LLATIVERRRSGYEQGFMPATNFRNFVVWPSRAKLLNVPEAECTLRHGSVGFAVVRTSNTDLGDHRSFSPSSNACNYHLSLSTAGD
jgi:hypothetical protein